MKKFKNTIAVLFGSFLLIIILPIADAFTSDWESYTASKIVTGTASSENETLSAPTIDSIPATVDASTYTISGKTSPNAKITAMGGPYDLLPVDADNSGNFKIEVALSQNQVNQYVIKAELSSKFSPDVTVYIVEGSGSTGAANTGSSGNTNNTTVNITSYGNTTGSSGTSSSNLTDAATTAATSGNTGSSGGSSATTATKTTTQIQSFKDTKKTDWFHDHVDKLREHGVISGYANGNFGPQDPVTRGQMMKIACKTTGLATDSFKKTSAFPDVDDKNPFLNCIHAATQQGWVSGYDNGKFGSDDKVTRAQAAKIIVKAFELDLIKPDKAAFPDVKTTDWFYPYVETLVYHKILNGYPDGTFKPDKILNRAEISKITVKAAENSAVGITAGFSDVIFSESDCRVIAKISSEDETSLAQSLSDQETLSSLVSNFQDTYDAAKEITINSDLNTKITEGKMLTIKEQALANMANAKKNYESLNAIAKNAKTEYDDLKKKETSADQSQSVSNDEDNKKLAVKLAKITQLNNTAALNDTEKDITDFLANVPKAAQTTKATYKSEASKAMDKWWAAEESALKAYKEYLQMESVYMELWIKEGGKKADSNSKQYLKNLEDHLTRVKRRVNKSGESAIEGAKKQCAIK